jgi:hypothetical protein
MITVSISLPEKMVSRIDLERKHIARSRYTSRLLEKDYETQNHDRNNSA